MRYILGLSKINDVMGYILRLSKINDVMRRHYVVIKLYKACKPG
jgi:hypothetical protein